MKAANAFFLAAAASMALCAGSQAHTNGLPTAAHVVACLRAAGWSAQDVGADGAKLVFARAGGIAWTISLAPPKPHAGWTASKRSPTPKERATLNRCIA